MAPRGLCVPRGARLFMHTNNLVVMGHKRNIEDRRLTCMLVGNDSDSAGDIYHMLNLKLKIILLIHDIQWIFMEFS